MSNKKRKEWETLSISEFAEAWKEPLTEEEKKEIEASDCFYNRLFFTSGKSYLISQTSRARDLFDEFFHSLKLLTIYGPGYAVIDCAKKHFEELVEELKKMEHLPPRE